MNFNIEKVINLNTQTPDTVDEIKFGHDTNNALIQYYKDNNKIYNNRMFPDSGIYDDLQITRCQPRLTNSEVSGFGVKSNPLIGGFGFWTNSSKDDAEIIIPINSIPVTPPLYVYERVHQPMRSNASPFPLNTYASSVLIENPAYPYEAWFSFNGATPETATLYNDGWACRTHWPGVPNNEWINIDLGVGNAKYVDAIAISNRLRIKDIHYDNRISWHIPVDFTFVGSNHFQPDLLPESWVLLHTVKGRQVIHDIDRTVYRLDNPGTYRHYRMIITLGQLNAHSVQVGQIELLREVGIM